MSDWSTEGVVGVTLCDKDKRLAKTIGVDVASQAPGL